MRETHDFAVVFDKFRRIDVWVNNVGATIAGEDGSIRGKKSIEPMRQFPIVVSPRGNERRQLPYLTRRENYCQYYSISGCTVVPRQAAGDAHSTGADRRRPPLSPATFAGIEASACPFCRGLR